MPTLCTLARANDTIAEDLLMLLVDEVYKNQVPRNRPGRPKHEPRLSNLLDLLKVAPFNEKIAKERSDLLRISLESFRDDKWIDAPTHPDFLAESHLDIVRLTEANGYEMPSWIFSLSGIDYMEFQWKFTFVFSRSEKLENLAKLTRTAVEDLISL